MTIQAAEREYAVWYRVRGAAIDAGHNTALCATLIPAMAEGGGLSLPGSVSPRLLAQSERVQALMAGWYPALRPIAIDAPGASAPTPRAAGVASMFSAGVDSFYSVLENQKTLTHLITMHGHDIAFDEQVRYERIIAPIREIAQALGLSLIEVHTNLRTFADRFADWTEQYFGAAMVSVAQLLSPTIGRVLIPPSLAPPLMRPWGSHPELDPLWSTEAVEIEHGTWETNRLERMRRIVDSPLVRKTLRVCLRDRGEGYNCCRCGKCLRTMVSLRVLGVLEQCESFPEPLDLGHVARIETASLNGRIYTDEILQIVLASGRDPTLAQALRDALDGVYTRGVWGWPRRANKLVRRLLSRGTDRFGNPIQ